MIERQIELDCPVPINCETLRTSTLFNPYDYKSRSYLKLSAELNDFGSMTVSLLPLDHAYPYLPCRNLNGDLSRHEVHALIASQQETQRSDYVFPAIVLTDVWGLGGRLINPVSCSLERGGDPAFQAVFTYKRCPLMLVTDFGEDTLQAAFWRKSRGVPNPLDIVTWPVTKFRHSGDRGLTLPTLPGKLLVLSQADIEAGNLALRFALSRILA